MVRELIGAECGVTIFVVLHDSIKQSSEETVARPFIEHLKTLGAETRSWRRGEPTRGEPDIVCAGIDGKTFGIEIAASFYNSDDARQLRMVVTALAREGKRQTVMGTSDIGDEDLPAGVIRNPDAKLAANLQATMVDHCLKRYGMPCYLVLDGSWAPLTSAEDAPAMLARLTKPTGCPYGHVFLALTRNWSGTRVFFEVS